MVWPFNYVSRYHTPWGDRVKIWNIEIFKQVIAAASEYIFAVV
jgi:hypothetical protein